MRARHSHLRFLLGLGELFLSPLALLVATLRRRG